MSTDTIAATRRDASEREAQRPASEDSPHERAGVSEQRHEVDRLNPDVSAEQPCDCRIATAVRRSWSSSGYRALWRIECQLNDGVLVIRGSVPSYYHKQMAQELVRCVEGVDRIVNELTVPEYGVAKEEHENQTD